MPCHQGFWLSSKMMNKLTALPTSHKGPSTNRFRPPIADLFRDGGGGKSESTFKKKIRMKPQLVLIKHRQYKIQPLPI